MSLTLATRGLIAERAPVRKELATLISAIVTVEGKGLGVGKQFSPNHLVKVSQEVHGLRDASNALPPKSAATGTWAITLDGCARLLWDLGARAHFGRVGPSP